MWYRLHGNEKTCLQNVIESKELDQRLSYIARKLEKRGILIGIEGYYRVFSVCFEEFVKNVPKIETEKTPPFQEI